MRRLSAEEAELWQRITASVRSYTKLLAPHAQETSASPLKRAAPVVLQPRPAAPLAPARSAPGETLDGGWDRRLRRGTVAPDVTIDLHGHTLPSAHAVLDAALERAIAMDARLILLITGRPPRPSSEGTPKRGLIRAAIGDWLGGSRHAGRIAAVRNAHPRHGGAGALYIVMRRNRER